MIRKTSYVSNIIQTFNSIYPFNFIIVQCPKAQRELFLTWLQTERSNFSYEHVLASLLRYMYLPRLQGTKIRGCHFCLPSALTSPCNHSMWSVLSGFSLRSETKVPSPEAFTAVTTLQMSALAYPLSLLSPQKTPPYLFKLASFPMSPFRAQCELLRETERIGVRVCVCACAQNPTFFSEGIPPPIPKGDERGRREGRRDLVPSRTQQSHWMPSDAGGPISAHMAECPTSPCSQPAPPPPVLTSMRAKLPDSTVAALEQAPDNI